MKTKICKKCNKNLEVEYFELRADTNKLRNYCKKCNKGYITNRKDKKLEEEILFLQNKKRCSKCLVIKDLDNFGKDKYTLTGLCSLCKECIKKKSYLDKDKIKNSRLKRKYNIDLDLYNKLYTDQKGCCKICNIFYDVLKVDHNHNTGNFRGLLCHTCNIGLGYFFDNESLILKAISYLKDNYETNN